MSTDRTLIPNKAIRRFEKFEGIPLQIINELFSRMQMPENLQLAFWEQVANKAAETIVGRVARIDTLADGTTRVHIMSDDGGLTLFEHPRDMKDYQLDEFKRAQNHGLKVRVVYQDEGEKKPINEVQVLGKE